jgi:predicted secreted hydrolase
MATWNKFHAWAKNMVTVANLDTDQFTIALTNTAPVAANSVLADITEISYTNLTSRNITTTSSSQTGGVYTLVFQDLTLTASGSVPSFRYAVLYDNTLTSPLDPVVSWWDYGSSITMANGETFTVDLTGAAITLS